MPTYHYRIIDKDARVRTGTIEARLRWFAKRTLQKEESTILLLTSPNSPLERFRQIEITFGSGFSALEEIMFYRNFSAMLGVGMPVATALDVLTEQSRTIAGGKIITGIRSRIEGGAPLSQAMLAHPSHFKEHIAETVRVAEMTGDMVTTLGEISDNLERDYEISRRVVGAIMYPVVILTVLLIVSVLLIVVVLPKIVEMFDELGAELPFLTRALIGVGRVLSEYPFLVATGVLGVIGAFVATYRTKGGKLFFHKVILQIPVFGLLVKEYNQVRFFRALRTLFASGVSLFYSVEVANKTMRNVAYQEAISQVGPALLHGAPLSEALSSYPHLFNLQTRRMLQVGEQAGKYDESFNHLTRFFERSVHHRVELMNSVLEPILILVVGIVVGGIALSIFAPIYKVSEII